MSWTDYFSNVRGQYVKKAMFDVLKSRYAQNEKLIDRLSVTLMTEDDVNGFLKMVADIYETAYLKAVEDHREQLQKAGLVAKVVSPKS